MWRNPPAGPPIAPSVRLTWGAPSNGLPTSSAASTPWPTRLLIASATVASARSASRRGATTCWCITARATTPPPKKWRPRLAVLRPAESAEPALLFSQASTRQDAGKTRPVSARLRARGVVAGARLHTEAGAVDLDFDFAEATVARAVGGRVAE